MKSVFKFALAIALTIIGYQVLAQSPTRTISASGRVVNQVGIGIPFKQVNIMPDTATLMSGFSFIALTTTTDSLGNFVFASVPFPSAASGTIARAGYAFYVSSCNNGYTFGHANSQGQAITGVTLTVCDSIAPPPTPGLKGTVSFYGLNASDYTVAAYKLGSASVFTKSFTSANYTFDSLPTGTYYVQAWLNPTNSLAADFFPTYSDTATTWTNAKVINYTAGGTSTADIQLRPSLSHDSISFIDSSGHNSHTYVDSLNGTVSGDTNLISNHRLAYPLVFDRKKAVIVLQDATTGKDKYFTHLDANGNFLLKVIPFGTYRVRVEYAKIVSPVVTLVLGPGRRRVETNFVITNGAINIAGVAGKLSKTGMVSIYPNPATDNINISATGFEIKNVKLINATGQIVSQFVAENLAEKSVSLSGLTAGVYNLIIENSKGEFVSRKVVKQ